MIKNLQIERKLLLDFRWFIKYQVQDREYISENINSFLPKLIVRNSHNLKINDYLERLKWIDFKIYSSQERSDGTIIFEIEFIDYLLNPTKRRTNLIGRRLEKPID